MASQALQQNHFSIDTVSATPSPQLPLLLKSICVEVLLYVFNKVMIKQ